MKKCPKCEVQHEKEGKFCSRQCANSRSWSEDDKLKKSNSAKKSQKVKEANKKIGQLLKGQIKVDRVEKICSVCKEKIISRITENRKYHKNCYLKIAGGYRMNSGNGKWGWYKGYWCQSSYELVFVIYHLDHKIEFERNKEGFEYKYNNKKYKFFPDFKIGKQFIEVKGYKDKKCEEKIKQFPHNLKVLFLKDMVDMFIYVESMYGKDFIKFYENSPYNFLSNNCKYCNSPCKKRNTFCNSKCSAKYHHELKNVPLVK